MATVGRIAAAATVRAVKNRKFPPRAALVLVSNS